jgi:hypothetical protein
MVNIVSVSRPKVFMFKYRLLNHTSTRGCYYWAGMFNTEDAQMTCDIKDGSRKEPYECAWMNLPTL